MNEKTSPLDPTRVLIAIREPILGEGAEALLKKTATLEINRLTDYDAGRLARTIDSYHPDILILEEDQELIDPCILFILIFRSQTVRQALVLSLDDNRVQIYKKEEVTISMIHDFIQVVDQELQ